MAKGVLKDEKIHWGKKAEFKQREEKNLTRKQGERAARSTEAKAQLRENWSPGRGMETSTPPRGRLPGRKSKKKKKAIQRKKTWSHTCFC